MQLVDTHAHLYLPKFANDREAMLKRARTEGGVSHIFLPNIDSESIESLLALEAAHPDFCFAMMGLHPCDVKESFEEELKVVKSWLYKRKFCAVGEIGIDLYWDKTFFEFQKIALLRQMEWAQDLKIPIVLHSRDSTEEILQVLEQNQWFTEGGILHCFSGSVEQAKRTVERGFLLGIGGVLTYKKTNLPEIVRTVGLENIVLETDAPFLAPEPHRGKRNESAYVRLVAQKLAEILATDLETVATITTKNALSLFLQH